MNKWHTSLVGLLLVGAGFNAHACGGFGNVGDGCADNINGVEIWDDGSMEIDVLNQVTWSPGHVCEGTYLLKFDGSGLPAKTSVALSAYLSNKPLFFRCSTKNDGRQCGCQFIVIGNHVRD